MAFYEFRERVRIAACFLSPATWADPAHPSPDDVKRAAQMADIWLTPAAVRSYEETDFDYLPRAQQVELSAAVAEFRRVAVNAPLGVPATQAQVDEAFPQLLTIMRIMPPDGGNRDAQKIREAVWAATRGRDWLVAFDVHLMEDHAGQDAVWVRLVVDSNAIDLLTREFQHRKNDIRAEIWSNFDKTGVTRWLYLGIWGRDEIAPVVLGGAAA